MPTSNKPEELLEQIRESPLNEVQSLDANSFQSPENVAVVKDSNDISFKSTEISDLEKLKYYTDLYKFYFELPLKIFAAYSAASTFTLAVAAYFTRELQVIGWLATFIVIVGITIGIILDRTIKPLDQVKLEVENLLDKLNLNVGPNFYMMKFVTRLTVVLLVAFPIALFLMLYFFFTK